MKAAKASLQKGAKSRSKPVNPLILVAAVGAFVLFILFPDGADKKPKIQTRPDQSRSDPNRDLAAYQPEDAAGSVNQAAENFFRMGFREYRERNYLRARAQFRNALMVSPGHALSRLYLQNCEIQIKSTVETELIDGKRALKIGRLHEAKSHFESVLRLLFSDPSNPAYIEAQVRLKDVKDLLAGIVPIPSAPKSDPRLPASESPPSGGGP